MSLKLLSDAQHSRQRRWMLTLVIVLAMLIPAAAAFAAPTSGQGTVPPPDGKAPPPASVPGDICVEGTVIDWKEEPLTEGWIVFPTAPDGTSIAGKGPELDDDDNETNKFSFDSDEDGLYPGEWTFTIDYSGLIGNWESVEPYTDSFTVELEGNGHECVQIRFKLAKSSRSRSTKSTAITNCWTTGRSRPVLLTATTLPLSRPKPPATANM